jgi:deoxyribonuclease-1-like protein
MKITKFLSVLLSVILILAVGCEPSVGVPKTIKIASWNIENFGKSKAIDEHRMRAIAAVLKNYDIIAVQEISNVKEMSDPGCPRNENACPGQKDCNLIRNALEKYLNQGNGLHYRFAFSPQVKDERYLFIYNPNKVTLLDCTLVSDQGDSLPICASSPQSTGRMVRQPFKAKFRAGKFDFVLLTVHTSPSINLQELEGLDYFYKETEEEGEPDIIILGDLNAGCNYLKPSDKISLRVKEYIWVVNDGSDTTVSSTKCAYDRIIFKSPTSEDFTGNWGVYKEITADISDHYLIWAEFWTGKDTD